jgi:hypothetical protein
MELTMTNVVFIIAGIIGAAVMMLVLLYLNGGAGTGLNMLVGIVSR